MFCSEAWNVHKMLAPESIRTYFSGLKMKLRDIDPDLYTFITNPESTNLIGQSHGLYLKKYNETVSNILI